MARPIEATPVLEGRDAERFLDSVKTERISEDRQRWMDNVVRESKVAEKPRSSYTRTDENFAQ